MGRAAGLALAALLCAAAVSTAAQPDPLRRRGELRVSWRSPSAAKPHAEVTAVAAGGPGAAAGLQVGDRIATIAGRPLRTELDLEREAMALREGQPVPLSVERGGKTLMIRVTPSPVAREQHRVWPSLTARSRPRPGTGSARS